MWPGPSGPHPSNHVYQRHGRLPPVWDQSAQPSEASRVGTKAAAEQQAAAMVKEVRNQSLATWLGLLPLPFIPAQKKAWRQPALVRLTEVY